MKPRPVLAAVAAAALAIAACAKPTPPSTFVPSGTRTDGIRTIVEHGHVTGDVPTSCMVRYSADHYQLPDPSCTPGVASALVTQATIGDTICKAGYATSVRAPSSETGKLKIRLMHSYHRAAGEDTELDHLIPLELGGSNNTGNLWPQRNDRPHGAGTNPVNSKDPVENTLHKAVCDHRVQLADAQQAIVNDWTTAVARLGLTPEGTS